MKVFRTVLLVISLAFCGSASAETLTTHGILPVTGMVTMVDLGANSCIPCKMMAPILEELKTEYMGKAAIVFIDVWKNPEEGKRFKVSMIPTQVFFDQKGKEVYRHIGFMDKKSIMAQLTKMGVAQPPTASNK